MKKVLIIFPLWFILFLFFNCKNNAKHTDILSDTTITITLTSIDESFQDTSYFKRPEIIVLETTDESLLSDRISRIITDDSMLFIFDDMQDQVFVFDLNGKFINKINKKGQGPKEYVQICDFAIDKEKKQIILSADIPAKLMYFSYDCTFLREESLTSFFSKFVKEGEIIYGDYYMGKGKKQIHIFDFESGLIKERLDMIEISNYLGVQGNSLSRGQDVLFVRRYDNSIYEMKNGEMIKKYNVDFKNHSFPERFKKEIDEGVIIKESRDKRYIYAMSNAFNSNNYITFYTNMGIFFYDKRNETLKGFNKMNNTHLMFVMQRYYYDFDYYLPLENTDKMVFFIEDPYFIKHIVRHNSDELKKDKDYTELRDIADKMTDDNNPILFIYEFKD